jgi:pyruvate formate lyase activating enzyme
MREQNLTRREFIFKSGLLTGGICTFLSSPPVIEDLFAWAADKIQSDYKQQLISKAPAARYWISTERKDVNCLSCHSGSEISDRKTFNHEEKIVKCLLCAQECIIKENERGRCNARINIKGKLKTLVYGRPISIHIDPIEKKPFYHFLPGREAFSLATSGCPLSCQFCQNWEISQAKPEDFQVDYVSPEAVVENTRSRQIPIIAFTYNEPTVFTEYLTDIARSAKKKNIRTVLVSCGFMNEEPLKEMCEVLDAIKIDLKGFSEQFYHKVSSAQLKPVLRSIKQISKSNVHLEIVNLVVPTLNDSEKMLHNLADWIIGEIGPEVPVHFTRFHPDYKLLNLPPTPIETIEHARDIAMSKGLHYVFVGNIPGHPGNSTYCPKCGKIVIKRTGLFTTEIHLNNGICEYCNNKITGVWS